MHSLQLAKVLSRKNPYLFKAKYLETPGSFVKAVVDAYLSSQEETIFGQFFEGLAIFVCAHVFGGKKSAAEGIDVEFERGRLHYFVSIKSGPNWGNSSQRKKLLDNFKKAKRIYSQGSGSLPVQAVEGCCYGRLGRRSENRGDYLTLRGQRFWEFISSDPEFYKKIIKPIGYNAREKNLEFAVKYEVVCEEFTQKFRKQFCRNNLTIDWEALVRLNSQAKG